MTTSLQKRVGAPDPIDGRRLGEVLDFMRVIWELDHALQSRSKRMETSLGVTGPQRLVIRIVGRFPGIPAGELAALLHVHPSTLTGILKRLERRRLLKRRIDPRDGRRFLFSLTDAGRDIDREREGTIEIAVERALAVAPAESIAAARALLTAISANLGNTGLGGS